MVDPLADPVPDPGAQRWALRAERAVAAVLALLAFAVLAQVMLGSDLPRGDFSRMGPGYWPQLLALALLPVAALLLWRSWFGHQPSQAAHACAAAVPAGGQTRAAMLTLAAVLAFALLAPYAGVALGTALLALLAARAASNPWPQALLIGAALTLLGLLVFVLALQVPFRLLPPALATALGL